MIRFLISFITIDRPSLTEMRLTVAVSQEGRAGTVKIGGTNSGTFAKCQCLSESFQWRSLHSTTHNFIRSCAKSPCLLLMYFDSAPTLAPFIVALPSRSLYPRAVYDFGITCFVHGHASTSTLSILAHIYWYYTFKWANSRVLMYLSSRPYTLITSLQLKGNFPSRVTVVSGRFLLPSSSILWPACLSDEGLRRIELLKPYLLKSLSFLDSPARHLAALHFEDRPPHKSDPSAPPF